MVKKIIMIDTEVGEFEEKDTFGEIGFISLQNNEQIIDQNLIKSKTKCKLAYLEK